MPETQTVRATRSCEVCGGVDDHPRHVVYEGTTSHFFHMDCHATQGCDPCRMATASGLKGDDLRRAITTGGTA